MRQGGKLDLIVVDHLQLMQSAKKAESRQQEVTEISRNLKMIAKELECPVIALSQLSRQIAQRKGGKPVLSDLRESGAIEQDADLVIFLHKPDADSGNRPAIQSTDIIIAKNRNGMCTEFPLIFKGDYCKFVNPTNFSGEPPAYDGKFIRNDDSAPETEPYTKEDLDSLEKFAPEEGEDDDVFI